MRTSFVVVPLLWLFASHAAAQANAEVLRPNPLREGWSGGADASLALLRGNVELLDVGGAGRIEIQTLHRTPAAPEDGPPPLPFVAHRVFLTASGRWAARAGAPFLNQAFAHARWTSMWHERVGSDLFAQVQHNEFQRLNLRVVAGLGLRVDIVHEPTFMAWAGSGYMFEHDRVSVQPGAPDAPETFDHRWTSYLTLRLAVLENQLLVQNTLYCQPRFDELGDVRVLEELEVLSRVGTQFLFGATFAVLYDSQPPTAVAPADLRLVSMLRLDL